jgi:hypothetical protein
MNSSSRAPAGLRHADAASVLDAQAGSMSSNGRQTTANAVTVITGCASNSGNRVDAGDDTAPADNSPRRGPDYL